MTTVPQAYLDHLAAVTGGDVQSLRTCWHPEGALEFPYAASVGTAARLEGHDAITGYFDGLALFTGLTISDLRAWRRHATPDCLATARQRRDVRARGR